MRRREREETGFSLASIVFPSAVVCRNFGVAPCLRSAHRPRECRTELHELEVDLGSDLRRPRKLEFGTFLSQIADVLGAVSCAFYITQGLIPIVVAAGCFNQEVVRPIGVCVVRTDQRREMQSERKITSSGRRLPSHCHTYSQCFFHLHLCSGLPPWPSWDLSLGYRTQEHLI